MLFDLSYVVGKAEEGGETIGRALVHAGIFQHAGEYRADLLLENRLGVFGGEGVPRLQFLCPIGVLGQDLVGAQVSPRQQRRFRLCSPPCRAA